MCECVYARYAVIVRKSNFRLPSLLKINVWRFSGKSLLKEAFVGYLMLHIFKGFLCPLRYFVKISPANIPIVRALRKIM